MTPRNMHLERLRDAFLTPDAVDPAEETCLDPKRIWAMVRGELAAREVGTVADHAGRCLACAREIRAAQTMAQELGEAPERLPDPAILLRPILVARINKWLVWLGTPALVATSLLFVVRGHEPGGTAQGNLAKTAAPISPPAAARAPETGEPASVELLVADGTTLPRDRFLLHWRGLEDARYDVTLMTEAEYELVLSETELDAPELLVPEQTLAKLEAGTGLQWQVVAHLPGGGRLRSPTYRVRLQ